MKKKNEFLFLENFSFPKTEAALLHDAVKIFSSSLRDFSLNSDIEVAELDCTNPTKWEQGELILKLLDQVFLTSTMISINDDYFDLL